MHVVCCTCHVVHGHVLLLLLLLFSLTMAALRVLQVRDGDCQRFCYPGVPHHWATMMLRMLEQQIYGLYDGLVDSGVNRGPHG
jgi:hypothetical protein